MSQILIPVLLLLIALWCARNPSLDGGAPTDDRDEQRVRFEAEAIRGHLP